MKVINVMIIEILQKRSNFDISLLGVMVPLRMSRWWIT